MANFITGNDNILFFNLNNDFAGSNSFLRLGDNEVRLYRNEGINTNGLFLINNATEGDVTLLQHTQSHYLIFEDDRFAIKFNGTSLFDYNNNSNQLSIIASGGSLLINNSTLSINSTTIFLNGLPIASNGALLSTVIVDKLQLIDHDSDNQSWLIEEDSTSGTNSITFDYAGTERVRFTASGVILSNGSPIGGATGLQGPQGQTGIQGMQGSTGLGMQGTTGLQGPQGQTGIQGLGFTGLQGLTGILGLQGTTGLSGSAGPDFTSSTLFRFAASGASLTSGQFFVSGAGVEIPGKLTVGGLIDPTGLQLTDQISNPGSPNTLWVNTGGQLLFGANQINTTAAKSYAETNQNGSSITIPAASIENTDVLFVRNGTPSTAGRTLVDITADNGNYIVGMRMHLTMAVSIGVEGWDFGASNGIVQVHSSHSPIFLLPASGTGLLPDNWTLVLEYLGSDNWFTLGSFFGEDGGV